jgi:NitT/TauT family transport system substrate-binding protein
MSILRIAALLTLASALPAHAAETPYDVTLADPASTVSFSASYIAKDFGIFKANGLNVKIAVIHGNSAINAVVSGDADFVEDASPEIMHAIAHGARLLMIAETADRPTMQIVLRKSLAEPFDPAWPLEKRIALLRGRMIAVNAVGSMVQNYLFFVLKRAGIDPGTMQVPILQPPSMLAALQSGQIDGFIMPAPWSTAPVVEGKAIMIASGPQGDPSDLLPFANNIIATRAETCEKRRPLCFAIGRSFIEATTFLRERPTEAFTVIKKRFPTIDEKVLKAAFATIGSITTKSLVISREGLDNAQRISTGSGLAKSDLKLPPYKEFVTDEFVK